MEHQTNRVYDTELAALQADVTALLADVAALQADITTIAGYTIKIDDAATDGLSGTNNSAAYRAAEVERHLHSFERWLETAAVPNAEVHVADSIGSGSGAFQIDAGNLTWGAWVQILGSSDIPVIAGSTNYDIHKLVVDATERNETYFIQIAYGASGAAALAAGEYTELVLEPTGNQAEAGPITVQSRRETAGNKAWVRCMCPGQNTATLDFYVGLHEYEG